MKTKQDMWLNGGLEEEKNISSFTFNTLNSFTLLTGMSHEMRTYLNAIVGYSFFLKSSNAANEETKEFSSQILESCGHLIRLFDSFLDSAIVDTGNLTMDLKLCNLNTLLDDLLSEFRGELRKEGNRDVIIVTDCTFPDCTEILIDSAKILRIIRCLFDNARKNTKSGYIKIGFSLTDEFLSFYILDSGKGYFKDKEFLHSENISESLKKFFDAGSAINITLAKKLIQFLEGTIWINWNGLAGTGLHFSIPARVPERAYIPVLSLDSIHVRR
jgi:two-component system, sensor histidine kinase and response regulator